MFSGTFFFHHGARNKAEFSLTPEALVELIRTHNKPSKDDLQWIKLAGFGELRSSKDSLRHNGNVRFVTGVEGDYDCEKSHIKMSFDEAVQRIEDAGLEAIVYTTPSHTPQNPHFRVLCPLSDRYKPVERDRFMARLNGVFDGAFAPESFVLSQSFYFGWVSNGHGGPPEFYQVEHIEGQLIDKRDDLDAKAQGPKNKQKTGEDGEYEYVDFPALIRILVGGGDYHPILPPLIGTIASRGHSRQECKETMRGLFEAACLQRPDISSRWKEVIEVIDYVYNKEEAKTTAAEGLPTDITMDDFYAYLPKHDYLYVPTQSHWPPATINSRLPKRDRLKATRWLDKNRAVSQKIWAPGAEQIVLNKHLIQGGWIDKLGAIVFNQYQAGRLYGGEPKHAGRWLDLVKKLYPVPAEHEHILDVLAYKLQHPELKINHALVLGGGMRIGKDTILLPIKRALGEWNCYEAKPTTIMSNFNPYMRSVLLVINEARDLGETKRHEFYLHMKDVIASPPETVVLNDKHEKGIHIANVTLVIMTTNHRTDGIYLPPDDGRHFCVWSELTREDHEEGFFDAFYDWLDDGGDAHVAAWLRTRDVSHFKRGRPPPQTPLFYEIVAASRPTECSWLDDIFADWKPSVFILESLVNRADGEVREWLTNPGNRGALPYRLEVCGYVRVGKPGDASGRWRVGGKLQNIYGDKNLSHKDRIEMARKLSRE